jgi:hypothetical protein
MSTGNRSQSLSPEALEALIRPHAATAKEIVTSDWTAVRMKKWCADVGTLEVVPLINLGMVMDADVDPIAQADPAMQATRPKVLRDVITSLIHHHNSTHLEDVIIKLNASTKQLDTTMFRLTVVGVFLTAMQMVMADWKKLSYEHLFLMFLVFGLGMALIIPIVLLMRQARETRSQGS